MMKDIMDFNKVLFLYSEFKGNNNEIFHHQSILTMEESLHHN
jgi:hypothetical protein